MFKEKHGNNFSENYRNCKKFQEIEHFLEIRKDYLYDVIITSKWLFSSVKN